MFFFTYRVCWLERASEREKKCHIGMAIVFNHCVGFHHRLVHFSVRLDKPLSVLAVTRAAPPPPPPLVWSHPAQRAVREGAMASRRPARVCAGVLSCLSSLDPPPPPPAKEVLVSSRKSCACFLTFPTNVREQCDERRRESLSPE